MEVYGAELLGVPHDLFLRLREAYDCASVDDFWDVWSAGAEEGLFRAYCRAGGRVAGGAQRYLGCGRLRIRRRRLGGRSVGGVGSSRLYRVSQGDDVDVTSAQYFVNSSLAPVILFWRIGWMPCIGTGLRCVVRDLVGLFLLWSLGLGGFLLGTPSCFSGVIG